MPIINPNLLRKIPLFQLLDNDEISALAEQLDQQHYWTGQIIFNAGDQGGTMYIVQSGEVEIFIKDPDGKNVTLDRVREGDLFGELSLLDAQARSASAKAVEETLVFIVDRHDLEMLVKSHPPAALDIMTMLGKRIREVDYLVSTRVVARNPNDVEETNLTFSQRLADMLASVAGDMRFVYFSVTWFTIWIVWNVGLIPGLKPFDPFPFGFLTMVVSLEAIFLATFVLVSQNRAAERDKLRNEIEYDVNIKAELEIRDLHNKIEELQDLVLGHLKQMNSNLDAVKLQTQTARVPKLSDNHNEG